MSARGRLLTTAAVLFALLAVSNLLKPLQIGGAETGVVFFGKRLAGTANTIAGPAFGLALLAYATGIWRMRRWVLPLAWAYAAYVLANLALFSVRTPQVPGFVRQVFGIVYAVIAVAVSAGTALLLSRRKQHLTCSLGRASARAASGCRSGTPRARRRARCPAPRVRPAGALPGHPATRAPRRRDRAGDRHAGGPRAPPRCPSARGRPRARPRPGAPRAPPGPTPACSDPARARAAQIPACPSPAARGRPGWRSRFPERYRRWRC